MRRRWQNVPLRILSDDRPAMAASAATATVNAQSSVHVAVDGADLVNAQATLQSLHFRRKTKSVTHWAAKRVPVVIGCLCTAQNIQAIANPSPPNPSPSQRRCKHPARRHRHRLFSAVPHADRISDTIDMILLACLLAFRQCCCGAQKLKGSPPHRHTKSTMPAYLRVYAHDGRCLSLSEIQTMAVEILECSATHCGVENDDCNCISHRWIASLLLSYDSFEAMEQTAATSNIRRLARGMRERKITYETGQCSRSQFRSASKRFVARCAWRLDE